MAIFSFSMESYKTLHDAISSFFRKLAPQSRNVGSIQLKNMKCNVIWMASLWADGGEWKCLLGDSHTAQNKHTTYAKTCFKTQAEEMWL